MERQSSLKSHAHLMYLILSEFSEFRLLTLAQVTIKIYCFLFPLFPIYVSWGLHQEVRLWAKAKFGYLSLFFPLKLYNGSPIPLWGLKVTCSMSMCEGKRRPWFVVCYLVRCSSYQLRGYLGQILTAFSRYLPYLFALLLFLFPTHLNPPPLFTYPYLMSNN